MKATRYQLKTQNSKVLTDTLLPEARKAEHNVLQAAITPREYPAQ
jgi:hypothetical protein